MRSDRGITLTSLIIYVIGMIIVVGIIATFTSFFYKNVNIEDINKDATQYTKFSSLFLEDINKDSNYVVDCKTNYIIFASGNQYTFLNGTLYKNEFKICDNVERCDFSYSFKDSKYFITVNFKTESIDMSGKNAITFTIDTTA